MITCFLENKDKVFFRHVTVNTILIHGQQVLLGKRDSHNGKPILESGKWGLLGGFLDHNENLIQAAKREIAEESGWKADSFQLFRINDNPNRPKEDRQNVDIIFIARAVKQIGTSDEEVSLLQWFNIDKLPKNDEIAFDHGESLLLYKEYLKKTSAFRF